MTTRIYRAAHGYTATEWTYPSTHRAGSKANEDDARKAAVRKYGTQAYEWEIRVLGLDTEN